MKSWGSEGNENREGNSYLSNAPFAEYDGTQRMATGKVKNSDTKTSYKNGNGGLAELLKELWNAAVALRGSIEPSDYKRYVLPLIFLRFLSLRYEKRVAEIGAEIADPKSDLFTTDKQLALEMREDPDNFKKKNVFLVPEAARWDNIVKIARADDIKLKLDNILALLEKTFPKLKGLLHPFTPGRISTRRALPASSICFPRTSSAPRRAAWTC